MQPPDRILVFQTAFTGDVVLTLPMLQVLHRTYQNIQIDIVVVPGAADVIANHQAIHAIIPFDKKVKDRGIASSFSLARRLGSARYDAALIPHRSLRSAAICYFAGIPRRIGFSTSAGKLMLTDVIAYEKDKHEIQRNLSLLSPLGIATSENELPQLFPSQSDLRVVEELVGADPSVKVENLIAVAPGSVWATKRWLPERHIDLCERLTREGFSVALIGGKDDQPLGEQIKSHLNGKNLLNAMGRLTVLQSAALIGKCRVAITNDSSPMHLAVAMRTPVVAIFGATVPEFGFAPTGAHDEVVQTNGLACRPCAIHGGNACPIKTFECMKKIRAEDVLSAIHTVLSKAGAVVE